MKDKILALLAVLAVAFVGVAVVSEQADAAATGSIDVSTSVTVDRTYQVTFTLSGYAPLKGAEVSWTVTTESDGGAATITATSKTDVFGKAYATLEPTNTGKIKISATAEYLETEVASAEKGGISISALTDKNNYLARWTVADASNIDDDKGSRMYAFQYTDKTLMIDTEYMTNLNGVENIYVALSKSAISDVSDPAVTLIGPYALQDKIYADMKTFDVNGQTNHIRLYNYDGAAALSADFTMDYSDAAVSKLAIVPQYDNAVEGTKTTAVQTYQNLVRNESFTLSKERSIELVRSGYELVAWSHNKVAVDGFKNGNGSKDIPLLTWDAEKKLFTSTYPVEDILMKAVQAAPFEKVEGKDEPAYKNVQASDVTTIYGVWQKMFYTISYIDPVLSDYDEDDHKFAVDANDGPSIAAAVSDISGSTVMGAEEDSFGIISIVKRPAGDYIDYQYKLKIIAEDKTTVLADYNYASQLNTSACQIEMVNNGTWKIHHITQNIYISAIAVDTNAVETGVAFFIDYLKNNSGESATTDGTSAYSGQARLSLDLNDYPNIADQDLYMKGTYYRVLSDLNNVRVYGDIENLSVFGDGDVTVSAKDDAERKYEAYIDMVGNNSSYLKKDGTSWVAPGADDKPIVGDNFKLADGSNLDAGTLNTTIGAKGYEYQGGHSYDLILKTNAADASGLYLYGVQGVWNTAGKVWNSDGTALVNAPTDDIFYTPWSIYEDNSDGA